MMTRRMLGAGWIRDGNRMVQIFIGWHVDPEFVAADGQPKDLQSTGLSGSLSSRFEAICWGSATCEREICLGAGVYMIHDEI
jgi:hypothetical protein